MMFILQPYGGLAHFAMDQWNEYARYKDSVYKADQVEYTVDVVSFVPEYGVAAGVGVGGFLFLVDARPVFLNRKVWAKFPDYGEEYTMAANLSGVIAGAVFGVRKEVGPVEFAAYTRLLYPLLKLSWETSYTAYGFNITFNSTMRPNRTVGGGFALEVAYRVHPLLSVGLNAGYDHMVLQRYNGSVKESWKDLDGGYTLDTTYNAVLTFSSESMFIWPTEDYHWPTFYFRDNLSGARFRVFIRLNVGGGR